VCILFFNPLNSNAQKEIIDDFSKKEMPGWVWGGLGMKYSHEQDNRENGYCEIFTTNTIKGSNYLGTVAKYSPILFTAGNYIVFMIKGVSNDALLRIQILYDVDNNNKYNEDEDIMLTTKPISLNFNGWKEIKIKLDEENFSLISKYNDDFSVTDEECLALQFAFESGKDYKESKFESGLALISEVVNKDYLSDYKTERESDSNTNTKSYFNSKNYPNPFNPTTTISYTLDEQSYVTVTVYDRLGREVKTIVNESQSQGTHTVEFNASNLPSGIYFYRIKAGDKIEVRKMIYTK